MITSRVRKQLLVFVLITLVGVSYVGARYARLGRLFYDSNYQVHAQFAQSGGIFKGAEVAYRGVQVGQVSAMKLTNDGVDVVLGIDKGYDKIPSDTIARVSNLSAVGEQYVDLEPKTDSAPYLKNGSQIATPDTRTPVSTTALLTNLDELVQSVPKDKLRTVISSLGAAFKGTGPDLTKIIDSSTSFIDTANQNFDTTTALIRDSNTVLKSQADKASAIRSFSRDLSLFTHTLVNKDAAIRSLIDNGSATSVELRTFLEQNEVNLGRLIANLVTTGKVVVKHLAGVRQILVLYPYMVAGAYTVVQKIGSGADAGHYDARFGLVLQQDPPVCTKGYIPPKQQQDPNGPARLKYHTMDTSVHCAEPASRTNARGAQNAPRVAARYRAPVASYDASTGRLTWQDQQPRQERVIDNAGSDDVFGKDAWKWMLLQPALPTQK
ncbi:MlaD family protein [Nocardioides terrisoli]|uniref:MlaD family protein n=1 Tax=Nocardioides terrisoli TaxID=3388267 RepID=UPI00287BC8E9|nr:MlaD family protein [Nocardioides marmorisolisilvae]